MRLDKFLADCGIGTRTEIKKLIKSGSIRVTGYDSLRPELKIDENKDEVFAFGERIIYKKHIYLIMNKPQGFVSATWDKKDRVVLELVPEEYLHFEPFPVGRLDIDTEGLLILTDDGDLAHRLLSPKKHVPKTYFARLESPAKTEYIDKFKKGVTLDDGYKTKPATLEILNENEINLTISEGKFHQVKRMFESVGNKVEYLKRIKMNNLELDESLELGQCRELTEEEFNALTEGV